MPEPIAGALFYLYLIVDIWSRKIVGWDVYERETAESAAQILKRAVWTKNCFTTPLVLHADNGSPIKGATMKTTMERLDVTASFSRPRVSNDNAFSKALLTCQYVPGWLARGFATVEEAWVWVQGFVRWYNPGHRHSAIRFVTPDQRHPGDDRLFLANRHQVY